MNDNELKETLQQLAHYVVRNEIVCDADERGFQQCF